MDSVCKKKQEKTETYSPSLRNLLKVTVDANLLTVYVVAATRVAVAWGLVVVEATIKLL
jgi:hypothetical protein